MLKFQKNLKLIADNFDVAQHFNKRPLCIPECVAALEDAHVFMFQNFDMKKLYSNLTLVEEIDLPFKKCLFEVREGFFFHFAPAAPEVREKIGTIYREVKSVLVEETTPKKYNVYLIAESGDLNWLSFHNYMSDSDGGEEFKQILSLIQIIIGSLKGSAVAKETVKESMKLKVKGKWKQVTIKNITHIYPDKSNPTPRGLHGKPLEYSHRWFVCGHWRKITGIGKGRDGVYNEDGFTWVVPHEKGPLDKELVQKIRVVHPNLTNSNNTDLQVDT